jgi:hypothetical protein
MAASNTPNPYAPKTERIPLVGNHTNRLAAASKDQVFYNVIPESVVNPITETKKVWLNKRGAFNAETTVIGGGGVGRAIYYWPETGKVYTVIGTKVYENTTEKYTLTTSTGTCWFAEFKGTNHLLVLGDGTDLVTITTGGVVTDIADVDLPVGPITPVFFDSYIFVAKAGTPEIYNSNVDVPSAWTSGDFISAEQYADDTIALIRQINYVVAFGQYSTEFFFDAANASGSPLERNEGVSMKVGLAARDTVAQIDRRIFWVGQTQTGDPAVWQFEGLTASEISSEAIRKILVNEGSNLANATAWICSHKGHALYVINLNARTIVFDLEEKMWVDWSINSGGNHAVLPFKYATEGSNNKVLVLHNTDGKIYELDPALHVDDAGAILVEIITDKVDFGTTNFKQQIGCTLVGDVQSTGTVTLSWSDDDYVTYSATRSLSLSAGRAYTKAGGVFRRRSYKLLFSTTAPFRAEAIELTYQLRVH